MRPGYCFCMILSNKGIIFFFLLRAPLEDLVLDQIA